MSRHGREHQWVTDEHQCNPDDMLLRMLDSQPSHDPSGSTPPSTPPPLTPAICSPKEGSPSDAPHSSCLARCGTARTPTLAR